MYMTMSSVSAWDRSNIFQFLIYLSQNFTLCNLLDEVASVERINGNFIIEEIILRQQYEYLFKR